MHKFLLALFTHKCYRNFLSMLTKKTKQKQICYVSDAYIGRESRGSVPLPFFDTDEIVPSNSSTNIVETLRKLSLKNERIH